MLAGQHVRAVGEVAGDEVCGEVGGARFRKVFCGLVALLGLDENWGAVRSLTSASLGAASP